MSDREPRYIRLQKAFEESNDGEPLNPVQLRHITEEYVLFLSGVSESPIGRNLTPAQVDARQAEALAEANRLQDRRLQERAAIERNCQRDSTESFYRLFRTELQRLKALERDREYEAYQARIAREYLNRMMRHPQASDETVAILLKRPSANLDIHQLGAVIHKIQLNSSLRKTLYSTPIYKWRISRYNKESEPEPEPTIRPTRPCSPYLFEEIHTDHSVVCPIMAQDEMSAAEILDHADAFYDEDRCFDALRHAGSKHDQHILSHLGRPASCQWDKRA